MLTVNSVKSYSNETGLSFKLWQRNHCFKAIFSFKATQKQLRPNHTGTAWGMGGTLTAGVRDVFKADQGLKDYCPSTRPLSLASARLGTGKVCHASATHN